MKGSLTSSWQLMNTLLCRHRPPLCKSLLCQPKKNRRLEKISYSPSSLSFHSCARFLDLTSGICTINQCNKLDIKTAILLHLFSLWKSPNLHRKVKSAEMDEEETLTNLRKSPTYFPNTKRSILAFCISKSIVKWTKISHPSSISHLLVTIKSL